VSKNYCTCEGDNSSIRLGSLKICCACGRYVDEAEWLYQKKRVSNAQMMALILTVS
jgi:hypothetical protein